MKKKTIVIVVIVLLFSGIAYKLAANKKLIESKSNMETDSGVPIPVNVITAHLQDLENKLVKPGTLIPSIEANISSVTAGRLKTINFELGDIVKKGSVLATVDNEALQLQLEAAQISKEQAERDYKRYKVLLKGDATTTLNFQNAKLEYENAKNQIKQIKERMADNRILAPISGQVNSKEKEAGEFVSAGTILGHIVNVNQLKVDVMVSESVVYTLEKNDSVLISTNIYPGITFHGKIIYISNKGDEVHNYKVEIALKNRKDHPLKAGTFVLAEFNRERNEKLLLIPKTALIESLDKPMIYVAADGKAIKREVIVGKVYDGKIEVVKGLQEGEKVITSGLINIMEGTSVEAMETIKKN